MWFVTHLHGGFLQSSGIARSRYWETHSPEAHEEVRRRRIAAALGLLCGFVAIVGVRIVSEHLLNQVQQDPSLLDQYPRFFAKLEVLALCVIVIAMLVQAGTALDLARALRLRLPWLWACAAFLGFVGWFILIVLLVLATSRLNEAPHNLDWR